MYIQFGGCGCKGIQLDEVNFILTNNSGGINIDDLFVLQKMLDHNGTIAEISFSETAEMVARVNDLIQDGLKYRKIKELMK
jgi:hypothetical protein